jgi:homoaconitase
MLRGSGLRGSSRLLKRSLAIHANTAEKDCSSLIPPYPALIEKLERVRKILSRPLTLAEKILYSHVIDPESNLAGGRRIRGETYLQLRPQRVAMQDASAQ